MYYTENSLTLYLTRLSIQPHKYTNLLFLWKSNAAEYMFTEFQISLFDNPVHIHIWYDAKLLLW